MFITSHERFFLRRDSVSTGRQAQKGAPSMQNPWGHQPIPNTNTAFTPNGKTQLLKTPSLEKTEKVKASICSTLHSCKKNPVRVLAHTTNPPIPTPFQTHLLCTTSFPRVLFPTDVQSNAPYTQTYARWTLQYLQHTAKIALLKPSKKQQKVAAARRQHAFTHYESEKGTACAVAVPGAAQPRTTSPPPWPTTAGSS